LCRQVGIIIACLYVYIRNKHFVKNFLSHLKKICRNKTNPFLLGMELVPLSNNTLENSSLTNTDRDRIPDPIQTCCILFPQQLERLVTSESGSATPRNHSHSAIQQGRLWAFLHNYYCWKFTIPLLELSHAVLIPCFSWETQHYNFPILYNFIF
jgi:hypothetical protein